MHQKIVAGSRTTAGLNMYETFYHLQTNPFSLMPDPAFCFSHSGHRQAREYLEYALRLGEGIVMVTGRPGTGKTTLAETFLGSLTTGPVRAARIAASSLDADELLRAITHAFDIENEYDDRATLRHCIRQFFEKLQQSGRRALLIIDEAQGLPCEALDELRLLADLQSGSQQLLQLFLIGQEQLQDQLLDPEMDYFQQRVIANYHLVPLGLMEARDYIEYRLLQAGWQGDPELTGAAVLDVYRFSKGVPRHINKLCNRLLLLGYGVGSHTLDGDDVQTIVKEMDAEQLGPINDEHAVSADAEQTLNVDEFQPDALSDLAIRDTRQAPIEIAVLPVPAAGIENMLTNCPAGRHLAEVPVPVTELAHDVLHGPVQQTTEFRERAHVRGSRLTAMSRWQSGLASSLVMLIVASLTTTAVTAIFENEAGHRRVISGSESELVSTLQTHTQWRVNVGEQQVVTDTQQTVADADDILLQRVLNDELPAAAAGVVLAATMLAPVSATPLDAPLIEVQAGSSRDADIDYLLEQGHQALADMRLLTPALDSAYYYFQSALRLAPDNTDAIAGIRQITERYVWLANRALEQKDRVMADRYIARGLSLQPDNVELQALREALREPVIGFDDGKDATSTTRDDWQKVGGFISRFRTFLLRAGQERPEIMATYQTSSSYVYE